MGSRSWNSLVNFSVLLSKSTGTLEGRLASCQRREGQGRRDGSLETPLQAEALPLWNDGKSLILDCLPGDGPGRHQPGQLGGEGLGLRLEPKGLLVLLTE